MKVVITIEEQINIMKHALATLSSGMFHLYYNWRREYDSKNPSRDSLIAQCMLQMAICKIQSILKLSEGTPIAPKIVETPVLDIPSLNSILRSLYEQCFVFHNIFVEQETEEERKIVLGFWEINGMNNRQGLKNVPEKYKEKERKEREENERIKADIRKVAESMKMADNVRKDINGILAGNKTKIKGYKFVKDENGVITKFKDVRMEDFSLVLMNEDSDIYKFLSFQTHPSFLGLLQFGQMYNSNTDSQMLRTILTCTCMLSRTIINDFKNSIEGAGFIYQNLPEDEISMIECIS